MTFESSITETCPPQSMKYGHTASHISHRPVLRYRRCLSFTSLCTDNQRNKLFHHSPLYHNDSIQPLLLRCLRNTDIQRFLFQIFQAWFSGEPIPFEIELSIKTSSGRRLQIPSFSLESHKKPIVGCGGKTCGSLVRNRSSTCYSIWQGSVHVDGGWCHYVNISGSKLALRLTPLAGRNFTVGPVSEPYRQTHTYVFFLYHLRGRHSYRALSKVIHCLAWGWLGLRSNEMPRNTCTWLGVQSSSELWSVVT